MAQNEITTEVGTVAGGKIVFAADVIATIASLAASEIEGVDGLAGNVVEGITGKLNAKKNLTKGIKVDVGEQQAAIDMSVNVRYGYKIHEVCAQVQKNVKNSVETMTGLNVIQVNVTVQSVSVEKKTESKQNSQE